MLNLFMKKESKSKRFDYLNEDIKKLEKYFKSSKSLTTKYQIRDKSLFIRLKKKVLTTNFTFIKNAKEMLYNEEYDDIYLAIDYINEQKKRNLSTNALVELELFSALLYEIVGNNTKAKNAYLQAIKLDDSPNAFKEYKEFQERINELKNHTSSCDDDSSSYDYTDETIDTDSMLSSAQKIESIAKCYIKSKKSLQLAQKYYKQSLKIYKKLATYDSKKYKYRYILSLIKSVELFKMELNALNEAEALIFHSNECQKTEQYLLNKIQMLKRG